MSIVFINEAHDKVKILARFEKMLENGIIFRRPVRDSGDQILNDISC